MHRETTFFYLIKRLRVLCFEPFSHFTLTKKFLSTSFIDGFFCRWKTGWFSRNLRRKIGVLQFKDTLLKRLWKHHRRASKLKPDGREHKYFIIIWMVCVCGRYNARSDWPIVGHYSPEIPTDRLRARKTKGKSLKKTTASNAGS